MALVTLNAGDRRRAESLPAAMLLVALSAIAPLSIDMFLPSLPTMTEEFGANRSTMQLAVLLFILAFAGSQLVYGPASDRLGRRPVLFAGLSLFVAGGLVSLLARTPEQLIAGRVLQGLGGGAGPALAQAMVLDVYGRERAARVIAYMAVALPLAPAIAPIIGGFLHEAWGWHSVFVTLAALGLALLAGYRVLLPETNPAARRAARLQTSVLTDYRSALSSRTFVSYALVMGLMFSGQLVFISTSAFVLIEELGLDERVYGFTFAFVAGGLMAGAWTSSRLVTRFTSRRVVILGAGVSASASAVLAAIAWLAPPSLPGLLLPMVLVGFGLGITRPSAVAGALIEFPQMAGLASAVLGFTQMLVASSLNIVYGALVEPGSRALASGVCFAMFAGLGTILVLRPGRAARDLEETSPARPAPAAAAPASEAGSASAPAPAPAAVALAYLGRPRGPVFSPQARFEAVRPAAARPRRTRPPRSTPRAPGGYLPVVLGAAALAVLGAALAAAFVLARRPGSSPRT